MARVVAASQPSRMARHDRAEVLAAPRSAAPTGCASAAVRAPPSSSASVISSLAFAATASHRRGRPRRLAPAFFSALRRAPPFHLPCRYGPRADRRRARCQEPQLYRRGRCRDRQSRYRGGADRAWRCHLRLQPLHQGRPSRARSQYRWRPRDCAFATQIAVGRAPARRLCRAAGAQTNRLPKARARG